MSSKSKKLVLILTIFILVIGTRKEAIETAKTAGVCKDSKESEGNEYLGFV